MKQIGLGMHGSASARDEYLPHVSTSTPFTGYSIVISGEKSHAELDPKANALDGNEKGALLDLQP